MTAATTSASGEVIGSTSGEVADRLRLATVAALPVLEQIALPN